jgi:iron complex outermembrane receptor protein
VGEQYMVNTDIAESKLESYFVNDFNINYEIKPKGLFFKSITLSALANNIFNKKYVSNGVDYGGGYIYYYPQATANFLVGATLRF